MINVAVTNESKAMTDDELANIVAACQIQSTRDFAPYWGVDAKLAFYPKGHAPLPKDAWWLAVFDDSDQAGALGYHDVTNTGLPLGKVFAGTDKKYGYNPSVTFSHEYLEMLGDPKIGQGFQASNTEWWAWEMCDAVEADELGYAIPITLANGTTLNVTVSDFILPNYFSHGWPGPYDFKSHLKKPLTLAKGGYTSVWTAHGGWSQKTAAEHPHQYSDRARVGSRRERRRTFGEAGIRLLSTVAL